MYKVNKLRLPNDFIGFDALDKYDIGHRLELSMNDKFIDSASIIEKSVDHITILTDHYLPEWVCIVLLTRPDLR